MCTTQYQHLFAHSHTHTHTHTYSHTHTHTHQIVQQEASHRAEVQQVSSKHQQELIALHKAHRHAMEGMLEDVCATVTHVIEDDVTANVIHDLPWLSHALVGILLVITQGFCWKCQVSGVRLAWH